MQVSRQSTITNGSPVPNIPIMKKKKKAAPTNRRKGSGVFTGIQGVAEFENPHPVHELMEQYGVVKRTAYRHRQRANAFGPKPFLPKDEQNWLRRQMTQIFPDMNSRYVYGAVSEALALPLDRPVVFGGKQNWKKLQRHEISKTQWKEKRNSILFCGGDAESQYLGNRNLVVFGNDTLKVRVGKEFVVAKLRLFKELPDHARKCYSVRLKHVGNNKFEVTVGFQIPGDEITKSKPEPGILSLDMNPDLVAATDLNGKGNYVSRYDFPLQRAITATKGKRANDILMVAIEIVALAKRLNKKIGREALDFGSKTKRPAFGQKGKKFNRMRHNFSYRAIIEAIDRRALKEGVKVVDVPPAYTSIIGCAKFAEMYRFNRHTAAAFCSGRRALGIRERQNFIVEERKRKSRDSVAQKPCPSNEGGRKRGTPKGPTVVRLKSRSCQFLGSWVRASYPGNNKASAHGRPGEEVAPGDHAALPQGGGVQTQDHPGATPSREVAKRQCHPLIMPDIGAGHVVRRPPVNQQG